MKINKIHTLTNKGQALITLLMFMIIAITVSTAAVIIVINNTMGTSDLQQATYAYSISEGGVENAILRLLRNPSYSGETLIVDGGTAVITVTGSDPKTIRSVGTYGNFKRTIEVVIGYTDNILNIISWNEVN